MPLSDLDEEIVSHRIFADEKRWHDLFARVLAEDPVHLTQVKTHAPFWAITKHADVMEVERQNDKFLNAPMTFISSLEEYTQRMVDTKGARMSVPSCTWTAPSTARRAA